MLTRSLGFCHCKRQDVRQTHTRHGSDSGYANKKFAIADSCLQVPLATMQLTLLGATVVRYGRFAVFGWSNCVPWRFARTDQGPSLLPLGRVQHRQ